ncbi:hypothetical protein ASPSYDRAFT_633862 [Aspergillus sydowii CBS 593.65]|uniref:Uncharacterized protein n=1 Tax=Aspergillus sydowii CBS 593.65 TaxID=1036612 RepID=A0A1L9TS22_9EURO|nr:uncharacterized protein ASPSYDRAFT_633862 [Aspergillus sydowii CBS 593.65]OJJ62246.1 hypothetical protein ASPSYDRAFT_633862 [Aspergillus sydowii CBS 593.65]
MVEPPRAGFCAINSSRIPPLMDKEMPYAQASKFSRDPRLANRGSRPSLPARSSYHEALQRAPTGPREYSAPDLQNDAPGDPFIRGITDLVQMAVSTAMDRAERERIQKKRTQTEDQYRKSRNHMAFPSTIEFFNHSRNEEGFLLTSIEDKIRNQETDYRRLASDLRNKWAESTKPIDPKTEERVSQLQRDLKLANERISDLHRDIAQLTSRNTSRDAEIKSLQETLSNQQKSFGSYTNSWALLKKDMDNCLARVKQLEENTKPPVGGLMPDTKVAINVLSTQLKGLDKAVLSLNNKLEELQFIQSTKDELVLTDMEELRKSLKKTEQDQERLTVSVQETLLRTPREPLDAKVDALVAEVRRWHSVLEPINMALHSLESRYNNLSTEPIVNSMVRAMQELYPSIDQVLKELQGHKRVLDKELPLLHKRIEQLESKGTTSTVPLGELNSIKAKTNDLSQSVGALLERYQWLSPEEIHGMQTRLESLAEKQTSSESVFQKNQTAAQEMLQEMARERESLSNRLTSLHDAFEKLNSDHTQENPGATGNEESQRNLELRIAALEKSTVHSYEKLKGQFDRIKKTVQPPGAPSEDGSSQGDSTPTIKMPPPPRPDLVDGHLGMKIKRSRPSSLSGDERSPAPSSSSHSQDSTSSPKTALEEIRKKKKERKKKRRRLESEGEAHAQAQPPINIE